MSKISSVGRYLDQPILIQKFEKKVPYILGAGATIFGVKDVYNTPKKKQNKVAFKDAIILGTTVLSALKAPTIASKIMKREIPHTNAVEDNINIINNILKTKKLNTDIKDILTNKKGKVLNLTEVDKLKNNLDTKSFNKLIPEPVSVTSKEIFKEIGWLSIFGAVPVLGGVVGGITADLLTEKNWKSRINNKIKEGIYQYLANIFLCNVGAGAALFALEKAGIKSKAARCIGMISGIILTGVIGGSYIANWISNKFINPMLSKHPHDEYRKPEAIDIGLHTDDIATVAVLSGLKWIEPALPILYTVSGYRAGIGYRNDKKHDNPHLMCK